MLLSLLFFILGPTIECADTYRCVGSGTKYCRRVVLGGGEGRQKFSRRAHYSK